MLILCLNRRVAAAAMPAPPLHLPIHRSLGIIGTHSQSARASVDGQRGEGAGIAVLCASLLSDPGVCPRQSNKPVQCK